MFWGLKCNKFSTIIEAYYMLIFLFRITSIDEHLMKETE